METETETWRCLPFTTEPVALQLATGDALLAGLATTGQPALRWYCADAPALVLGTGQPLAHVDCEACRASGIPLHRRSSGGTAVLIEPDLLMLDIALPREHRLHTADVTESYRWCGEIWNEVLHRLGIASHLISVADARSDTKSLDPLTRRVCFGGFSPYEVLVGSRKIVGLSQVRRRQGSLIQAGVYLSWKPRRIAKLLALEPDEQVVLVKRLMERATGVADAHPLSEEQTPLEPQYRDSSTSSVYPIMREMIALFHTVLGEIQGVTIAEHAWNEAERAAREQGVGRYAALADCV